MGVSAGQRSRPGANRPALVSVLSGLAACWCNHLGQSAATRERLQLPVFAVSLTPGSGLPTTGCTR